MILKRRMSDIHIFNYSDKKNNKNNNTNIDKENNMCPPTGPYSYTITNYDIGCVGCNQESVHSGTDCKIILFCCIPCSLIADTLFLPYTLTKWLCFKKK